MEVSISAVIAQVINFGIMYRLFSKFAAKPLADAIEDRKKLLQKLKNADKAYDEKLEIAKFESRDIVKEGMERKETLIAEAGILADKKRDEILGEARIKANKIISDAEEKVKLLQKEIEQNFSDGVKKTSLLVIKKLIKKDVNIKKDYLQEVLQEIVK